MLEKRKPSASREHIGIWFGGNISNKEMEAINLAGKAHTEDQLIELYLLLYPFIASDFSFREDIQSWAKKVKDEFSLKLKKFNTALELHIHPVEGLATLNSESLSSLEQWDTEPEDFNSGDKAITSSSDYTDRAKHRDPNYTAKDINRANSTSVSDKYESLNKYRPFDINKESLNTGDEDFV